MCRFLLSSFLTCVNWSTTVLCFSLNCESTSGQSLKLDVQTMMSRNQTDQSLNTSTDLTHSAATIKCYIYSMRHCLNETLSTWYYNSPQQNQSVERAGENNSDLGLQSHQMSGHSLHQTLMKGGQTVPPLSSPFSLLISSPRLQYCCKHVSDLFPPALLHAWPDLVKSP